MARVHTINIHGCDKVRIEEWESNDVAWLDIHFDDFNVSVFDITKEDLRAALYRSDMEEHDANSTKG